VEQSRAVSAMHALAMSFQRARGYFDLVDQFVVTNEFMLETMRRAGFAPERMTCIPTFVDTDRFAPPQAPGSETPYVLFCGRLHQVKGAHLLIEAMELLKARGRRVRLRIAGVGQDGGYVDALKRQVAEAQLSRPGALSARTLLCRASALVRESAERRAGEPRVRHACNRL
jgi:glycosyltransferase involved in cell wall biosynthesis